MPAIYHLRQAFTVVEVIVAIFLISLALGALEGTAAVTLQRLRESQKESVAVRLVQTRAELLLASPCTASTGIDSSGGVVATWSATIDRSIVWIDQESRYSTRFGDHIEAYRTAGVCP